MKMINFESVGAKEVLSILRVAAACVIETTAVIIGVPAMIMLCGAGWMIKAARKIMGRPVNDTVTEAEPEPNDNFIDEIADM